jgi:hypothetical protein
MDPAESIAGRKGDADVVNRHDLLLQWHIIIGKCVQGRRVEVAVVSTASQGCEYRRRHNLDDQQNRQTRKSHHRCHFKTNHRVYSPFSYNDYDSITCDDLHNRGWKPPTLQEIAFVP